MRLPVLEAALLVGLMAGCAHEHKFTPVAGETTTRTTPQYQALYSKPLTSLGAKYALLTPAAQTTVLAEVGSVQVYDVVKERRGDLVYYIVTFIDSEVFPPLYVAADGSVLNPDLSVLLAAPKDVSAGSRGAVTMSDVPAEVQKALHEQAPGAEVASIYRDFWGDHPLYIFSFKDEARHPTLRITAEGLTVRSAAKAAAGPSGQ